MSFFIKKNPYDNFKISSNKLMSRNLSAKNDTRLNCDIKSSSQRFLLSKILKGTKSILRNKIKFFGYMNEYQSIVAKSTFKRPDIQNYPLLRKEVSSMIPLKSQKMENRRSKKIIKNILKKPLDFTAFKEKYRHNLSLSMSSLENKNKKYYNLQLYKKEKEKEKLLLFSDFFYKWNNNKYESTNNFKNDNNQYSTLSYEENKIFYNDYSDFIKEKLFYLKKNKLENLQKTLKINILDSQKKKIKLKIISMKLIFEPINNERTKYIEKDYNFEDYQEIYNYRNEDTEEENDEDANNNANKNIITFPLSYVFLLYVKEIDFFKDILLSSIKFSKDYQKIVFEENEIYTALRREKDNKKKNIQKKINNRTYQRKGSIRLNGKGNLLKKTTTKILTKITIKNVKEEEKEKNVNFAFQDSDNNNANNDDANNLYKTDKKIVTIHANPDLRRKEKNKNKDKKDIKYTEYSFIWETPNKTYRVRIIMPIILFWSEHIKKYIIAYCDKDLFLFLFKNNFINWDYYVLNYLFSIKAFRQIILNSLSFYKNYNINNIKLSSLSSFTEREIKNKNKSRYISPKNKKIDYFLFSYINEKTILLNINKKIYNQLNENNESYRFFYTDNYSINSIIDFHSYHIFIEYNKLNSKICWEFALNFKQMKYLSNINKYENLETFLPKIIKTNFEDGKLSMDFSVFEFFNTKILEHNQEENSKNNSLFNTNINNISSINNETKKKNNNDMILVIKMPYIISEQYVKSLILSNIINKVPLTPNVLNALAKCQISSWSKNILKIINNKNKLLNQNKSSLNVIKAESFNEDNKNGKNEEFDDYINNYHNYKKTSRSLHYKKKKVNL